MTSLNNAVLDLKRLDLLARGTTHLHLLDARAKVLVTLVYIICIVSYDRYELANLLPFCIFPAVMVPLSTIPPQFIARKIALLCPFVLVVGIFNPLLDREILLQIGPVAVSGGWISFFSILIRSVLTIGGAFILIGTTGFSAVCQALERLGMPQVFAVQLLFLYRYIFVLADEGGRASRARELRACGRKGLGIRSFGSLVGHLLLRTWQRAERIHQAMLARGFKGEFHSGRSSAFGFREVRFVAGWSVCFIFLRLYDLPGLLGALVTGFLA